MIRRTTTALLLATVTWSCAGGVAPAVQQGVEEVLFDGTQGSLDRWRHVGQGSFELQDDGSLLTVGGLGMLWYPVREYTDFILSLEWRDVTEGPNGNTGVFVRFPHPEDQYNAAPTDRFACQNTPIANIDASWVAIACGHEIQVNDHYESDAQKTGSVYNFSPNGLDEALPVPKEQWVFYEVQVVGGADYEVVVRRDGQEIKRWRNSPGQTAARQGDPPTDQRQFASGYIGLQNHGAEDLMEIRDVRIIDLAATSAPAEDPAPDDESEVDAGTEAGADSDPSLPVSGAGALAALAGLVSLGVAVVGRRRS